MLSFIFLFLLPISIFAATSPSCPKVESCLALLNTGAKCPLFPLLPEAVPPAPGPSGFILTQVRPGLFHYSDDLYHSVIAYSSSVRRLAVIDFPRSPNSIRTGTDGQVTYLLVSAVRSVIGNITSPIEVHMIYGHRHLDHIGGAPFFESFVRNSFPNAPLHVYGTKETLFYLRRRPFTGPSRRPTLPTRFVKLKTPTIINISPDLTISLSIIGGHTMSDILAHVPPHKNFPGFVHVADVVESKGAPFAEFIFTTDINAYQRALKKILRLSFTVLSAGHGVLANRSDVQTSLDVTRAVLNAARNAIKTTNPSSIIGRVRNPTDTAFRNNAWSFYAIILLQTESCTKTIIRDWGCRLSLVDVFAESLCRTAIISATIEE